MDAARSSSRARTSCGPDEAGRAEREETTRLTPLRELQLVEAYRAGDRDAVTELLGVYQRRVYAVCYRMLRDRDEAADLTQDALVRIMEGLDGYDGRAAFSTWAIRVTMNCCLSHLRRERVRRHASLDDPGPAGAGPRSTNLPGTAEPSPLERVEQAELTAAMARALDRLDPPVRAILVLRDLQDLAYGQIAEVLDVPVGTVKSRLFRARTALRAAVEVERASMSGRTSNSPGT